MSDLLDRQLDRLHRQRRLQRAFDHLLPALGLGLGAAALAVMVVRLAIPGADWLALPLAAAGLLAPILVVPRAFAVRDERAMLMGHLDRGCSAQGLAMALAALPASQRDGDWMARLRRPLEDLALPPLRWAAGRGALFAVVCLLVALALPQRDLVASLPTVVGSFFRQASERVAALEQAGVIPPAESEQARTDLAHLQERATDQGMDQPTWEALDRIRQRLDRSVSATNQRLAQSLALSQSVAQAPDQAPKSQDGARLAQAVAELATRAPGLVPKLPAGAGEEELAAALAQAAAAGALSAEQAEAVKQLGLLRPQAGRRLDAAQARKLGEHLAKELAKAREALKKLGECQGGDDDGGRPNRPGRGGVIRGPGHTDLTWNDPLRTHGGGVEGLPAGAQLNPDGSVTLAEQVRDAEIDEAVQQAAVRAAARAFDPTAADARRAAVAPRHRAVVERYFASE
ncbi:MAG: hypothetical protein H0W78_10940 [Planctomycetes bacterium]|jgi:hypothetical protein|nr:hypothetical protein [Planctomycetota bacterium]